MGTPLTGLRHIETIYLLSLSCWDFWGKRTNLTLLAQGIRPASGLRRTCLSPVVTVATWSQQAIKQHVHWAHWDFSRRFARRNCTSEWALEQKGEEPEWPFLTDQQLNLPAPCWSLRKSHSMLQIAAFYLSLDVEGNLDGWDAKQQWRRKRQSRESKKVHRIFL